MDSKLYVERWLLTIKTAAVEAGLDAHVRAVDHKGGRLVALEVRKGPSALELRYRKGRLGPRIVAAATSMEILAPVRRLFKKVLAEHHKLLENGFRRFLRKSLDVVEVLEAAFAKDPGMLGRVAAAMGKQPEALQPAAVLQPGKGREFQTYPAIARRRGSSFDFFAWNTSRLLDLSYLFSPVRAAGGMSLGSNKSLPPIPSVASGLSLNSVELSLPRNEATGPSAASGDWSVAGGDWGAGTDALSSGLGQATSDVAGEGLAAAGSALDGLTGTGGGLGDLADVGSAVGGLAEAGGAAAEAVGAGMEGLSAAADALGGLADAGGAAADAAGGAVEVVAAASSCLGDASCSGIDLGGLDCNFG